MKNESIKGWLFLPPIQPEEAKIPRCHFSSLSEVLSPLSNDREIIKLPRPPTSQLLALYVKTYAILTGKYKQKVVKAIDIRHNTVLEYFC